MTYLRPNPDGDVKVPEFPIIQEQYGFVPNYYRAQTIRPEHLHAQFQLVNTLLIEEHTLNRVQKEHIFLVCSAANLSTYCVTAHCEIIRMLGLKGPEPEEIAINHADTDLPDAEKALLDYCRKLTLHPTRVGAQDVETLRTSGWTDNQILEAVLMVGLAKFANTVAFGIGTVPDFENARIDFPGGARRSAVKE